MGINVAHTNQRRHGSFEDLALVYLKSFEVNWQQTYRG